MEQHHHHTPAPNDRRALGAAFFINLAFGLVEFAGGIWVNSVAVLADAVHDLGDSLSLALGWYAQRLQKHPPDPHFTFGYARFSMLAALFNALVLVGGSVFMGYKAVERLFAPEPVAPTGMLALAVLGIGFNAAALLRLRRGHSLNARVIYLHFLEDALGWVAVLIGAALLHFVNWYWLDPALSIGIALFILMNAIRSLGQALRILLQAAPKEPSLSAIKALCLEESWVHALTDLHCWTLDGRRHILSARLLVEQSLDLERLHALTIELKDRLRAHGIAHATLECAPYLAHQMPVEEACELSATNES